MKEFDFECTFNYYSDDPYIFSLSALEEFAKGATNLPANYNIYLITKTNRMWFIPDSLSVNKFSHLLTGKYAIMKEYDKIIYPFCTRIPSDTSTVGVSPYPHRFISLKNSNNEVFSGYNIYEFSLKSRAVPFEVLYIGQSCGRKKRLNAVDRLYNQNHKALKKILIDVSESEPDKEICLFAFNFAHQKNFFSTDYKYFETTFSREQERMNRIHEQQIPRSIVISIIEEALINYFRPKYNHLLKDSIGKLNSKTVKFFHNIDLVGFDIELKTIETGAKLFSECVPEKKIHMIRLPISKDKDRLHFFNESDLQSSREENIDYLIHVS